MSKIESSDPFDQTWQRVKEVLYLFDVKYDKKKASFISILSELAIDL